MVTDDAGHLCLQHIVRRDNLGSVERLAAANIVRYFRDSLVDITTKCFLATRQSRSTFAAHGLKSRLSDYAIGIFKTAAEYQMVHGLALIAVAILIKWVISLRYLWVGRVGVVLPANTTT